MAKDKKPSMVPLSSEDAAVSIFNEIGALLQKRIEEVTEPDDQIDLFYNLLKTTTKNAIILMMTITEGAEREERLEALGAAAADIADTIGEAIETGSELAGEPTVEAVITIDLIEAGGLDDSPPPKGSILN